VSEPDPRPRPQYGEYATPEEQRARIAQPEATDALTSGQSPDLVAPAATPAAVPPGSAPAAAPAAAPAPGLTPRGRRIDRIATLALLGYGLVNVLFAAPGLLSLADTAEQYFSILGIDEPFTNLAAANVWGPVAGGLYLLGYAATAFFAVRMLRRGRLAFWVPIAGAIVTSTVVAICISVPLAGDPAFLAFVEQLSTSR
jgi:hypothetical protein